MLTSPRHVRFITDVGRHTCMEAFARSTTERTPKAAGEEQSGVQTLLNLPGTMRPSRLLRGVLGEVSAELHVQPLSPIERL